MKTITIDVSGMHCTSCALNIDCDLEDLPGVKRANTNYGKAQTFVEYDEMKVQINAITQIISQLGYVPVLPKEDLV